jgi:hypothetical protein
MCCRTNDTAANGPDTCRPDGLCQSTTPDIVWRESCTDPTWTAPECLQLCVGEDGAFLDERVKPVLTCSRWERPHKRCHSLVLRRRQHLLRCQEHTMLFSREGRLLGWWARSEHQPYSVVDELDVFVHPGRLCTTGGWPG